MKKFLPLLALVFLFCSCSLSYEFKTEEEKNYIGTWINPNAKIVISEEGKFAYELKEPGKSVTMNSNIERFEPSKLVVNLFVTESEFEINEAPFLNEEEIWQMKLDNRVYKKINE